MTPPVSHAVDEAQQIIPHAWTQANVEAMRSMRAEGMTFTAIAKALGTTKGTIAGRIRTEKLDPNACLRTIFWTPERMEKVKKLRAEGMEASQIAVELGTTTSAVERKAWRLGAFALPRDRQSKQERDAVKRLYRARQVAQSRRTVRGIHQPPERIRDCGPLPGTTPVDLFERTGCAFPTNHGKLFLFCNEPLTSVRPYCETHARMMVKSVDSGDSGYNSRLLTMDKQIGLSV